MNAPEWVSSGPNARHRENHAHGQSAFAIMLLVEVTALALVIVFGWQFCANGWLSISGAGCMAVATFVFLAILHRALRADPRGRLALLLAFVFVLLGSICIFAFLYARNPISTPATDEDVDQGLVHDSARYVVWASRVSAAIREGRSITEVPMATSQRGIVYLFGAIFWMASDDPISLIVANSLLVGIAAILTYSLALGLHVRSAPISLARTIALLASLFFLLMPLVVIQAAAVTMKEAAVTFAVVAMVCCAEASARRPRMTYLAIWLVLGIAMIDLRFYMIAPLAVHGAACSRRWLFRFRLWTIVAAVLLVTAVCLALLRFRSGPLGNEFGVTSQLHWDYLVTYSQSGSITATTFWRGSPLRAPLIFVRAALLLFNPTPPIYFADYYSGAESATVIAIVLLLPLVIIRVRGVVLSGRWKSVAYLIPLVGGLVIISAALPICSPRFNIPLLPFFALAAAEGFAEHRASLLLYYPSILAAIVVMAGIGYVVLKALVSV